MNSYAFVEVTEPMESFRKRPVRRPARAAGLCRTCRQGSLLLVVLLMGSAALAHAQAPSRTQKLFFSVGLEGTRIYFDEDDLDTSDGGGGLGLQIGYGFTRTFSLYLGVSGAVMDGENNGVIEDEYALGVGEIGTQLHFGGGRRALVPYLDFAFSGVSATYDERFELEFRGGAFSFGGGLRYFVSEPLALDVGLRASLGGFNEVELERIAVDIDEDDFGFGLTRLALGLTWFPLR